MFRQMDEEAKALARKRLKAKIAEVRKGGMNEFWLQLYIKENYHDLRLGLSEILGPYEAGYDFTGVIHGKKVVIEAERLPANFLSHGHDKHKVDILIVMADDETPRALLPKTIKVVDAKELVMKTHDARKSYREYAQARDEALQKVFHDPTLFTLGQLEGALRNLYGMIFEEEIYEGTPEDDSMHEAASTVALWYFRHYDLGKSMGKEGGVVIPKIVGIENRICKHGTDMPSEADWEHLTLWLGLLRDEYLRNL